MAKATPESSSKKKHTRRSALQRCEQMKVQLLEIQLLAMKQDETELAEACAEMAKTLGDALSMRGKPDSATDFATTGTGGPPS